MSNNQRLQDEVKAFVRKTITGLNIDWSDEDGGDWDDDSDDWEDE